MISRMDLVWWPRHYLAPKSWVDSLGHGIFHHKVMIPLLSAFDIDSTGAVLGFALASAFVWLLDFIFSFFRGYINFRTGAKWRQHFDVKTCYVTHLSRCSHMLEWSEVIWNTSIWIRLARITSFRWQIPLLHRFIAESTNLLILILRKLDRKAMKSSSALTGFVEMRMSHIAYRGWLQGSANVFVFTTQSTNHRVATVRFSSVSSNLTGVTLGSVTVRFGSNWYG